MSQVDTVAESFLGSTFKRFTWDGLGRLWGQCDHNLGGTTFEDTIVFNTLDSLGRILTEGQWIEGVSQALVSAGLPGRTETEVRYAGQSRASHLQYPGPEAASRLVTFDFDSLDRVSEARESGGALICKSDYIGSRLLRREYGNGSVSDYRNAALFGTVGGVDPGYDGFGRPVVMTWEDASSGLISEFRYDYNVLNRRVNEERVHLGHEDRYIHDSLQRLTAFDRNDEIATSATDESITSIRVLDGVDRMSSYVEGSSNYYAAPAGPPVTYYPVVDGDKDASGAPVSPAIGINQYTNFGPTSFAGDPREYADLGGLIDDGSGLTYTYDAWGRLSTVWQGAVGTGQLMEVHIYDALDRRLVKQDPSGTTQYLYAGDWEVVEERDPYLTLPAASGVEATQRQFLGGQMLDEHQQMLTYDSSGAVDGTFYYHSSGNGNVGALSDSSGVVVEYYEYSMLGQPTVLVPSGGGGAPTVNGAQSTVDNPYSFHGRRFEPWTGFFHFRNRFYDPRSGDFITLDPAGMWHHGQGCGYDAFNGDPWNWRDPYGLSPVLDDPPIPAVKKPGDICWHHVFPKELEDYLPDHLKGEKWLHSEANGLWLPRNVHSKLHRGEKYTDVWRKWLNDNFVRQGKVPTQKDIEKFGKRLRKWKFKQYFKLGFKAKIGWKASAQIMKEIKEELVQSYAKLIAKAERKAALEGGQAGSRRIPGLGLLFIVGGFYWEYQEYGFWMASGRALVDATPAGWALLGYDVAQIVKDLPESLSDEELERLAQDELNRRARCREI